MIIYGDDDDGGGGDSDGDGDYDGVTLLCTLQPELVSPSRLLEAFLLHS